MRLLNTKNPENVTRIYPWLIPTETKTRMDIAAEIYGRLKEKPDDTFVLIAIENNITRAVMIAYVSECRKRCVWLWQSQSKPGFRYGRLMFDALKSWSRSKRAKEIRMRTNRDKEAIQRKWGFESLKNGDMRIKIK